MPRAMLQVKALLMKFAAWPGRRCLASEQVAAVRLLVTRPREDAEQLAARLTLLGHEPVVAPLLEVRFRPTAPDRLEGVQAILATSANGVHGVAAAVRERDLPFYAVGSQTAEAARREGFATVISSDGDSTALAAKVAALADPVKGSLLHAAGAETAGRLSEQLQARGFRVDTVVLYDAVPVGILAPNAQDCLRRGLLDGVLIFSPRTSHIFSALVVQAGLASHCANLIAFCISAAAADALAPLQFARVAVAEKPNQQALLDLLPKPGPHA